MTLDLLSDMLVSRGSPCLALPDTSKKKVQMWVDSAPVAPWDAYGRGSSRCIFWFQI